MVTLSASRVKRIDGDQIRSLNESAHIPSRPASNPSMEPFQTAYVDPHGVPADLLSELDWGNYYAAAGEPEPESVQTLEELGLDPALLRTDLPEGGVPIDHGESYCQYIEPFYNQKAAGEIGNWPGRMAMSATAWYLTLIDSFWDKTFAGVGAVDKVIFEDGIDRGAKWATGYNVGDLPEPLNQIGRWGERGLVGYAVGRPLLRNLLAFNSNRNPLEIVNGGSRLANLGRRVFNFTAPDMNLINGNLEANMAAVGRGVPYAEARMGQIWSNYRLIPWIAFLASTQMTAHAKKGIKSVDAAADYVGDLFGYEYEPFRGESRERFKTFLYVLEGGAALYFLNMPATSSYRSTVMYTEGAQKIAQAKAEGLLQQGLLAGKKGRRELALFGLSSDKLKETLFFAEKGEVSSAMSAMGKVKPKPMPLWGGLLAGAFYTWWIWRWDNAAIQERVQTSLGDKKPGELLQYWRGYNVVGGLGEHDWDPEIYVHHKSMANIFALGFFAGAWKVVLDVSRRVTDFTFEKGLAHPRILASKNRFVDKLWKPLVSLEKGAEGIRIPFTSANMKVSVDHPFIQAGGNRLSRAGRALGLALSRLPFWSYLGASTTFGLWTGIGTQRMIQMSMGLTTKANLAGTPARAIVTVPISNAGMVATTAVTGVCHSYLGYTNMPVANYQWGACQLKEEAISLVAMEFADDYEFADDPNVARRRKTQLYNLASAAYDNGSDNPDENERLKMKKMLGDVGIDFDTLRSRIRAAQDADEEESVPLPPPAPSNALK